MFFKKLKTILFLLLLFVLFTSSCGTRPSVVADIPDGNPSPVPTSVSVSNPTSRPDSLNSKIPEELVGTWEHYLNAGSNGQTIITLELENDGTFHYTIGLAMQAGSGITETRYAMGASCDGKYKTDKENLITLYDAIGGRCEEKSRMDNLYELIERSQSSNDIKVEKREFLYTIDNRDGETYLTFMVPTESDADQLGLKALHDSPMKKTN